MKLILNKKHRDALAYALGGYLDNEHDKGPEGISGNLYRGAEQVAKLLDDLKDKDTTAILPLSLPEAFTVFNAATGWAEEADEATEVPGTETALRCIVSALSLQFDVWLSNAEVQAYARAIRALIDNETAQPLLGEELAATAKEIADHLEQSMRVGIVEATVMCLATEHANMKDSPDFSIIKAGTFPRPLDWFDAGNFYV